MDIQSGWFEWFIILLIAKGTWTKDFTLSKQSSTYNGGFASLATDGDHSTFSQTGYQWDSWWTGQFDTICTLESVEFHGEHPPMVILAGEYENHKGSRRPTLQNPRCKLVDYATTLGVAEWQTFECDVVRNVTTIDIVPSKKVDHSMIFYEITPRCR